MKNLNMIMIIPLYTLSVIFPLSSCSWLPMWMGLEINLLMFILISMNMKSIQITDSLMKYFLIQSSSSLIFLFSISTDLTNYEEWPLINAIVPPLALMLKMGLAPLHSWMINTASNFPLMSFYLFITMQKLIPLMILFTSWFSILMWLAIPNVIVGSLGGIAESSILKLLLFSSINNSGWMMSSLMISNYLFIIFFSVYTILVTQILYILYLFNMKWMIQIYMNLLPIKCFVYLNLMSLSGLPPLLGFSIKWIIIKQLILNLPLLSWTFIMTSTMSMFFYIKMTMNTILNSTTNKKWMNKFHKMNPTLIFLMMTNTLGIPLFIMLT
uniref:NADH-ubiquinone oxidoreductase chain 2 n=1 Tax=Pachypsylla venusta TaxID=38123 RepID=Q69HC4_PACVE|nr:NADH dehydrogenase subunit 2 [Pachypsylla venusta]